MFSSALPPRTLQGMHEFQFTVVRCNCLQSTHGQQLSVAACRHYYNIRLKQSQHPSHDRFLRATLPALVRSDAVAQPECHQMLGIQFAFADLSRITFPCCPMVPSNNKIHPRYITLMLALTGPRRRPSEPSPRCPRVCQPRQ